MYVVRGKNKSVINVPVVFTAITLILTAFLLLTIPLVVFAYDPNNPNDVYQAQEANAKKRQVIQEAQEGAAAQLADVQTKVDNLENAQIPAANQALAVAKKNYKDAQEKAKSLALRLSAAKADKQRIEKQLDIATNQYDASKVAVSSLAREEMRGSESMLVAQMVFSAKDSKQFVKALETSDQASRTQTRLLSYSATQKADALTKDARLKIVNQLIAKLKQEADENEAKARQSQIDAQNYTQKLKVMQSQLKTAKADLEAKQKTLAAQMAQEEAQQKIINAQMKKIAESARSGGGSYHGDGSGGFFSYPVANHGVTSGYGPRHFGSGFHNGLDFGYAHCGDKIYAAADGRVIAAGMLSGYGGAGVIHIDHGMSGGNHWMTEYLHMYSSGIYVHSGQIVKRGQMIGAVGNAGFSTGCHLHFGVWKNGSTINPYSVL